MLTIENSPSAPAAFLRSRDVFKRCALSRTTIWRRVREGTFPQPVQLASNRVAWLEADITAWIEAQHRASLGSPSDAPPRP